MKFNTKYKSLKAFINQICEKDYSQYLLRVRSTTTANDFFFAGGASQTSSSSPSSTVSISMELLDWAVGELNAVTVEDPLLEPEHRSTPPVNDQYLYGQILKKRAIEAKYYLRETKHEDGVWYVQDKINQVNSLQV